MSLFSKSSSLSILRLQQDLYICVCNKDFLNEHDAVVEIMWSRVCLKKLLINSRFDHSMECEQFQKTCFVAIQTLQFVPAPRE